MKFFIKIQNFSLKLSLLKIYNIKKQFLESFYRGLNKKYSINKQSFTDDIYKIKNMSFLTLGKLTPKHPASNLKNYK